MGDRLVGGRVRVPVLDGAPRRYPATHTALFPRHTVGPAGGDRLPVATFTGTVVPAGAPAPARG